MLAQVFWNSPRSLPVAIGVGLVTLIALMWLYPPQVKGLAWYWRWGLPALRGAGVLALAVALLKPAVLRPKTSEEQGAVIVLIDRSRSMSVADNARTPAQRVALADGLGRLGPGSRSAAAAAAAARARDLRPLVVSAERAWGDLEYARVAGRGVEAARGRVETTALAVQEGAARVANDAAALSPAASRERLSALTDVPGADAVNAAAKLAALRAAIDAVIAAATESQAAADERLYRSDPRVRAVCDELATSSRMELVEDALLRPGTGLLPLLGPNLTVAGFAVADEVSPLHLGVVPAAPAAQPATKPATTAAAPSLLVAKPDGRASDVAGAARKALESFENRDVAAVVLFSDGRQAGVEANLTSGLGTTGVPIFAVASAAPEAVRDVALRGVTAPLSAFVGETATIRAEVRPLGVREGEVQVKLAAEGDPDQVRVVKFAEGRAASAEFQFKLTRAGAQRVTLSLGGLEGEATADNNTAVRWIKVLSQKVKVAAYALPGWDYRYVRNALARTPWVDLRAAVLNPAAPRVQLSPEEILQQDVLILSDVPVAALDDAQWGAVYRLVHERGGSVILVAGPTHVPVEYGPHFIASSLLPYPPDLTPTWRLWPGEEPMFRVVPDLSAAGDAFLRVGGADSRLSGAQRWQMLPGFYRVLTIGRLKPSAQAVLAEASSGEPVLTQMRVGAGRTFLFGADETWRWRSASAEDVHDRFWLQLTRFAAGEPYAARSERLALDVDRVAFDAGESVQAKVRDFGSGGADSFRLEVMKDGKNYRSLAATPAGGAESGRFRARVGGLPEGNYTLRLSEAGAGKGAAEISLPLHVVAGFEAELADVSGDDTLLARLAESSGGELYRLEQMGQLAERLRVATDRRSRFREQRLWDSPYLFVLVVACFAAEWAARKRLGLA